MKLKIFVAVILSIANTVVNAQSLYQWKTASSGGYTYKYVTNDPTRSRFYTLSNGLTVILSQNNKEPNIVYKMAVRTGSNTDPKTNTGLAHYLEHLLFKGTDKFGTLDYAKEKPLLDKIENLYEQYNKTKDGPTRKKIYQEIDSISGVASNYAIANEYDKMMKAVGSQSTNAHTTSEETVYEENLPSNAVEKFLAVQSERFRMPVFRIFHTELEAVYEEKNRGLDDDGTKMYEGMLNALFPTHNYGQQTTIGTVAHLKNPSLVEIRKYYNKYYVPNNMALIMSGDINYDSLIKVIDRNFAYMVSKPFTPYEPAQEKALTKIQKIDINGPSAESLYIAYRGFPQNSHQSLLLDLIGSILSNGKAGMLDINLNKQQKVLKASAGYNQMKDYGMFILSASPKAGQSLEDAQKLLTGQIELLKKGSFDEGLIKATVANIRLGELQAYDSNDVRADATMTAFILNHGKEWDKMLSSTDAMARITKKEIVDFANQFFINNYVIVLKHKAEDKSIEKIEKPMITAVKTNANEVSNFAKDIISSAVKPIAPKFLDYKKDLAQGKVGIADMIYVQNTDNSIFRMGYRFEIGSYHSKFLPYAAQYLSFLSSDKYTAEDISKAFYNIACSYSVNVGTEETMVYISGLQENFDRAVSLLAHLLSNCKPNEAALEDFKARLLKTRDNAKLNKNSILSGLMSYAQYGKENPFNYGLSNDEIKNLKSADLIDILHKLGDFKHTIIYYGPKPMADLTAQITKLHRLPGSFSDIPSIKKFNYEPTNANKVYFADYDMVQAEIRWIRNAGLYNPAQRAKISLFNDYFGGGMGSIVFQTIRESKALAYSTFAMYASPNSRDKQNSVVAYVGTQADKMNEAIAAMNELLSSLPESQKAFSLSKNNALSELEAERISKDGIIYTYLADKKLGYDYDSRIDVYSALKPLGFDDLKSFHEQNISGKNYNYCVVGSEKTIKTTDLEKLGTLVKLDLSTIFGY
nr:insulinase family protein [Pedobacter kyonggii]